MKKALLFVFTIAVLLLTAVSLVNFVGIRQVEAPQPQPTPTIQVIVPSPTLEPTATATPQIKRPVVTPPEFLSSSQ